MQQKLLKKKNFFTKDVFHQPANPKHCNDNKSFDTTISKLRVQIQVLENDKMFEAFFFFFVSLDSSND